MDTSPAYVKMCKQATELHHIIEEPDYFCDQENFVDSYCEEYGYSYKEPLTWLPRQDQLQEMLEDSYYDLRHYPIPTPGHHRFEMGATSYIEGDTLEQLLLAFVMHECYNKLWSKEKSMWVSESQ